MFFVCQLFFMKIKELSVQPNADMFSLDTSTIILVLELKCETLFIFMQVPKSASFKWPALSSSMLSGFTSLRRQRQRHQTHVQHD